MLWDHLYYLMNLWDMLVATAVPSTDSKTEAVRIAATYQARARLELAWGYVAAPDLTPIALPDV